MTSAATKATTTESSEERDEPPNTPSPGDAVVPVKVHASRAAERTYWLLHVSHLYRLPDSHLAQPMTEHVGKHLLVASSTANSWGQVPQYPVEVQDVQLFEHIFLGGFRTAGAPSKVHMQPDVWSNTMSGYWVSHSKKYLQSATPVMSVMPAFARLPQKHTNATAQTTATVASLGMRMLIVSEVCGLRLSCVDKYSVK